VTSASPEAEPFLYDSPNSENSAFFACHQVSEKPRASQICFWLKNLLQHGAQSAPRGPELPDVALVRASFKLPV